VLKVPLNPNQLVFGFRQNESGYDRAIVGNVSQEFFFVSF